MIDYLSKPRRPLLATMVLALLLSACGGGSKSDASANAGATPTGATPTNGGNTPGSGPGAGTDVLTLAMRDGDVSKLPDSTKLIDAIKQQLALRESEQSNLLGQVWGGAAITYNPGRNSQLLTPQPMRESARTYPLAVGSGGNGLAIAGQVQAARVAAFGSNIIGTMQSGSAPEMTAPVRRLLSWLLLGQQQDIGAARSISLLRYSAGEQSALKNWFKAQFPNWTVNTCTDDKQLDACTKDSQLLLVGSEASTLNDDNAALLSFLDKSLAAGKPMLYQHTGSWGDGGLPQVAGLLGLAPLPYPGNYFSQDSAAWSSKDAMVAAQPSALKPMQALSRLVNHLAAGDYAFNWSQCTSDSRCTEAAGINSEFYDGAGLLKDWIASVETGGKRLFDADTPALLKQLVLLGDYYRKQVHYPMAKGSTPVNTFMRALFSDHALANSRSIQPAANLEGSSFSPPIPAGAAAVTVNRSFTTRSVDFSASAAVYALPGRALKVSRSDNSSARITVFVNQLRTGAAHVFGDAYDRPMYLWGNGIPLAPGGSIEISNPYGGIVYVSVEKSDTPVTASLQFAGVGQHAVYSGPASASAFAASVRNNQLGWSEFLTPGFEVHSTAAKMRQTLANYGDDVQKLTGYVDTYLYKDIYNLAAFNGRDLSLAPGVSAFCQANGWDCSNAGTHGLAGIQHFNTDQANCGYMCSGQPIDSYAEFEPLGWGESHEVGHNLQYGHFKVYGGQSGEVSNNIFPVHKWLHYNRDFPAAKQWGRDISQKETFALLQAAQGKAAPVDYVKNGLWFDENLFWGRLNFYWQLALDNRSTMGDEGWDLYRLLYLHDRLLDKAQGSDSTWSSERAKLGFGDGGYANRSAVQSITAEDYLVIVTSKITGRDQRNYFDMWGIKYSAAAAAQVASFGYPATSKRFWAIPCEKNGFKAPLSTPVAIDGTSAWPAAASCPP
ncbi:ImpA family metalloprotease [Pseudoduganella violaceinigra]|uniref:ImpA family metalloprotease n=1 Tax=Pseudoduganella violaceinigra TaxID=246602 RepID=UPI000407F73C|nr:ImpA family metalloprotease [Pseudoduganella violaceinigra]